MPPSFTRPPPEHRGRFLNAVALPEVSGKTLGEVMRGALALRLWCRACGRDTIFPPHGLGKLFAKRLEMTVEEFTLAGRCQTCGAQEAQASGFALEVYDPRPVFVRREHHGSPLRVGG